MPRNLVPLSEPDQIFERSGEAVVSHLVLPNGVDTERIVLNVDRAARLSRWAGASQLHAAMAEGEHESYDVSGVNIDADGSATFSGGLKRRKGSYAEFTYDDTDNPIFECPVFAARASSDTGIDPLTAQIYKASRLGIYVSKSAVEEHIQDASNKYPRGLVDENGWAKGLNTGLKEGILRAANARYSPSDFGTGLFTVANAFYKYWAIEALANRQYQFPAALTIMGIMRRSAEMHISTSHGVAREAYNPSFLPHCRLDRLAMTRLHVLSGSLVCVKK